MGKKQVRIIKGLNRWRLANCFKTSAGSLLKRLWEHPTQGSPHRVHMYPNAPSAKPISPNLQVDPCTSSKVQQQRADLMIGTLQNNGP